MKKKSLLSTPTILNCNRALSVKGEVAFSEIDFPDLRYELETAGEEQTVSKYLTDKERENYYRFNYEKRRVEWLAGRVAVKNAALELLGTTRINWQDLQVGVGISGRPFVVSDQISPDVSISHSGDKAVAMAVSKSRCGIDVQEVTNKVIKVEKKFATGKEVKLLNINKTKKFTNKKQLLTLLWSAKEALRKGVDRNPIPGFLELQLCGVYKETEKGFLFEFTFQRDFEKNGKKALLKTYQTIKNGYAIAIFINI